MHAGCQRLRVGLSAGARAALSLSRALKTDAGKLEEFAQFPEFGLGLTGGDDPHARDYAALLEKIKPRPDMQLFCRR